MIDLLANPIPPIVAMAAGILLLGLQPDSPGSWVVALSSLAWLNASLVLHRSRRTIPSLPRPEPGDDGKRSIVSAVVGIVLIASMAFGMVTWALVVRVLGLPASAVGGLAAAFAVTVLHAVARRHVMGADRIKLSPLALVATLGTVVGSVYLWLLRGGG